MQLSYDDFWFLIGQCDRAFDEWQAHLSAVACSPTLMLAVEGEIDRIIELRDRLLTEVEDDAEKETRVD
jgi:hypothetical protein